MSSELYDKYARINHIDQAIYESEQDFFCSKKRDDVVIGETLKLNLKINCIMEYIFTFFVRYRIVYFIVFET